MGLDPLADLDPLHGVPDHRRQVVQVGFMPSLDPKYQPGLDEIVDRVHQPLHPVLVVEHRRHLLPPALKLLRVTDEPPPLSHLEDMEVVLLDPRLPDDGETDHTRLSGKETKGLNGKRGFG